MRDGIKACRASLEAFLRVVLGVLIEIKAADSEPVIEEGLEGCCDGMWDEITEVMGWGGRRARARATSLAN